jgi:hypothetical protein
MNYLEIVRNKVVKYSFIDKWVKDENIRKYECVDLFPPPLVCPNNYFNLWNGFEIENIVFNDDDNIDQLVNKFNKIFDHFKLIFDSKENSKILEYCLDYIAFMIQNPGSKPNVSIVVKSKQGLGKNIISIIISLIFGSKYCLCVQKIEQYVFGQFNPLCDGIIFYTFDEMNIKVTGSLDEQIKNFITSDTIEINQKGLKPYTVSNFNHTFMFSNRDFPLKVDDDDRRLFCIDQGYKVIPSHDYFVEIFDIIKDKKVIRLLFDYFMNRDVSNFDAKTNRPETSFGKDLKLLSRSLELNFIIDYFERTNDSSIPCSNLFSEFVSWLNENSTCNKYNTNAISFGMKIRNLKIDSFVVKPKWNKDTKKTCKSYVYDIDIVNQWLINNKYIDEPVTRLL